MTEYKRILTIKPADINDAEMLARNSGFTFRRSTFPGEYAVIGKIGDKRKVDEFVAMYDSGEDE